MRRFFPCLALLLSMASQPALAQAGGGGASGSGTALGPDAGQGSGPSLLGPDEQKSPLETPRLRPPSVQPPEVGPEPQEGAQEQPAPAESKLPASSENAKAAQKSSKAGQKGSKIGEGAEVQPSAEASPAASATLLQEAAPTSSAAGASSNPIMGDWTAPASVLTLHGYLRLRGQIWNNFMLSPGWVNYGSSSGGTSSGQEPFVHFAPIDYNAMVCGSDHMSQCGGKTTRFANMRLRLQPTLSLSDDVRVHMTIDVFDNMVLGSTPNTDTWTPSASSSSGSGFTRNPGVSLDSFATTQEPPTALRNSFQDSIKVRRAWAEVTNRGIGQLRFGRMGSQWGLGIFQNAGNGIDSDYSTDVDRIMGITKIAGLYLVGSWDWANQGFILNDPKSIGAYPIDGTTNDNLHQWTMAVARRMSHEDQKAALARGDWVLNGGLYFVIRKQKLSAMGNGSTDPFQTDLNTASTYFFHRDLRSYTPDLWGQFLWKKLRLETEAVLVAGHLSNLTKGEDKKYKLLQFGWAFESEYRMMADKLGLYLYTGLATGDANVNGLSSRESMLTQSAGKGSNRITTFTFHPDYRIDLILWRSIMQRVAGAWYLRPSVSYDFLRNSFGQVLGARLDVIYSRAMQQVQTYGSDPNLGLEADLSAYYRSEDGPGLMNGFYSLAQFGLLFPFKGLGSPRLATGDRIVNPGKAWAFRVLLGVQF